MSWQDMDVVVGQAVTDRELWQLRETAAAGAAVLSTVATCAVEVLGYEDAQRAAPTKQEHPHWCWAACIESILRHYGVRKDQSTIVRDVYGAPVDLPELSPAQLYHVVNGALPRHDGTTCVVRGRYYPGALLTAPVLYNELNEQHPVMVVHRTGPSVGHAVVIYGATFNAFGPTSIKYFDPTPDKGLSSVAGLPVATNVLRWFAIRGD